MGLLNDVVELDPIGTLLILVTRFIYASRGDLVVCDLSSQR
jgi:hypothetical protein